MSYIPFQDISGVGQGVYDMSRNTDPIIMIKMSGGDLQPYYFDSQAANNYNHAIAAGKAVGMYHFAGGTDATAEADFFISACTPLAEDDVMCLDWEIENPDPVGWCNTFLTHVHDKTGVWPLIYMDIDRCNRFDWSPVFKNCGLWLAAPSYSFDADAPVKATYVAQQGPIVNGVDSDAWFGTVDEFKAYGYHVTPVAPPPVPVISPSSSASSTISPSSSASASAEDPGEVIPVTVKPKPLPPPVPVPDPGTVITPTKPTEVNVIEKDVTTMIGKYNKTLIAIAGLLVTFLMQHYGANEVTKDVTLVLTALGIYQVPNIT